MSSSPLGAIADDAIRSAFQGVFGRASLRTTISIVRHSHLRQGGSIVVRGKIWHGDREVGTLERCFELDSQQRTVVRHRALYINDAKLQRTGFGTAFLASCEELYRKVGVYAVHARAGGDVGYWANARWGFDWDISADTDEALAVKRAEHTARLVRARHANGGISNEEFASLAPRLLSDGNELRSEHLQHAWQLASLPGGLGRRLLVGDWDAIKVLAAEQR